MTKTTPQPIPFKAETRQLLDILIHSLYTEREIFLRELISNASDALTRLDFEMLTNRQVHEEEAELAIWITADPDARTLTVRDSGVGMSAEELRENLGVIAHSGARNFIQAAQSDEAREGKNLSDIIGQFGVGFYSTFMAAQSVRVISRAFQPEAQAAVWACDGSDTFTVEAAEKDSRGTEVIIQLKEDAAEFAQESRLREIIKRHSDFIPFPIYLGEKAEQANQRSALWRQAPHHAPHHAPRQVEAKDYNDFYRQLTLDFEEPVAYTHLSVDAPVQMYALLYFPARLERGLFSLRKEDGLKLYARKVLIQEYCKDLLPEYLRFIQGVVDSEDLPLNVSRESVQSSLVMSQLRRLVTNKVLDTLKKLAAEEPEKYAKWWVEFGRYIKQGIAIEPNEPEALYPLLRFKTTTQAEAWCSLDDYLSRMPEGQEAIYYIMGDDEHSVRYSPHLDVVRRHGYEVLLMTDPLDAFMVVRLKEYQGRPLTNVARADLKLPEVKDAETTEQEPALPVEAWVGLIERFKAQLGEQVQEVRMTDLLADSPARLVDPDDAPDQEMQRVYRMLKEDFVLPKKVLELNPRHPILRKLNALEVDDPRCGLVIEQVYENALLIEGLHKDPASMIGRIHKLIEAALE